MNNVGLVLKRWLQDNGISQQKAADRLGVKLQYLNAICNGRKSIGRKGARLIAEEFGLSESFLLTGEGTIEKQEPVQEILPASPADSLVELYARLITELEQMRRQTQDVLNQANEMKNEMQEARQQYLDAAATLQRLLDRMENQSPIIGIAADDHKLGCS